ncbi:hypothetical protein SAMN05444377_105135 [Flavobacterium fontis]|uniref:Permease n=2 Tax=Flavobacterium fontis TaxID=1124188 RepID=A0A1M5A3M3_9FLAO|nr:hypothetical protein SAMN05444377_105135 [Flavobacterium fontis]
MGLQRVPSFPKNTYRWLNHYVIAVALPSLTLYSLPKMEFSRAYAYPILMPWIAFVLAFLFFTSLGRFFGWSRATIGALILTAELGNTSFVGFPIVNAFWGEPGLRVALLVDQPGTFLVLSTLGIFTASFFSTGSFTWQVVAKKILLFPPFLAFLGALFLWKYNIDVPLPMQHVLRALGSTVSVVALVSVGLQLSFSQSEKEYAPLVWGLGFKLLLLPFLVTFVISFFIPEKGLITAVTLIESAMPPMISGAIVAANYGLNPRLCSRMISFGIPISLLSMYLWYRLLI